MSVPATNALCIAKNVVPPISRLSVTMLPCHLTPSSNYWSFDSCHRPAPSLLCPRRHRRRWRENISGRTMARNLSPNKKVWAWIVEVGAVTTIVSGHTAPQANVHRCPKPSCQQTDHAPILKLNHPMGHFTTRAPRSQDRLRRRGCDGRLRAHRAIARYSARSPSPEATQRNEQRA